MTAVYPFSAVALFLGTGHCADADRDGVGFACFICSIVMFCAGVATFGGRK